MKYVVKFFTLLAVFIGAILFFGSNMDEVVFQIEKPVAMSEASLPTIVTRADGVEVNCLYGYTSPVDGFSLRENVIAIESDKVLELLIHENTTDVRKLSYEVCDVTTQEVIAEGTVLALEKEESGKRARIRLEAETEIGKEYAVTVTLVDSNSRRIYYYFRLKVYENSCLAEKTAFIKEFTEHALAKEYAEVIPYLESTYRDEGTTYSRVGIKDSFYMVCWGNLQPKVLTEPVLNFSELYSNVAVGTMTYLVELETDTGTEQYYITEKYRIIATETSLHLLNYERTMEAVFNTSLASVSQNQLKLGVTGETDLMLYTNSDSSMLAFVRNKELWHYNMAESRMSKVFSMRSETELTEGTSCEDYEVRILKLYENGDVSFMVYGYMGRGTYEGKTGVVLYRYHRGVNQIEEQMYLPISEPYQKIHQELGSFCYMNSYEVFYFMIYDTVYSYNLITKEVTLISSEAGEQNLEFSAEEAYIAWQEEDRVRLLFLETGEQTDFTAPEGEFIRLLGRIDENLILGYGLLSDCTLAGDGEIQYPAYRVEITDKTGEVRKTYQKDGYYVTGAEISENSICFERRKKTETGWQYAEEDYILNSAEAVASSVTLEKRVTELMFDEYYIDLPSAYKMKKAPEEVRVPSAVVKEDTTVRIEDPAVEEEYYVVWSFGDILLMTENVSEAVKLADQAAVVGTVANETGSIVWERGVKYNADLVGGVSMVSCKDTGLTSRQAVLQMMADCIGVRISAGEFSGEESVKEFLEERTGRCVLELTGITLDEVLYFVYKGVPVYAMKDEKEAVLITQYSSTNVIVYNPKTAEKETLSIQEAEQMFLKAGNVFVSFLP